MSSYILLFMVFAHIVDDYYLQGILAKLKQRLFWLNPENYPKQIQDKGIGRYKYDWIVALFMHAFSWSFMIMLPLIIFGGVGTSFIYILLIINFLVHALIDHLKANLFRINLVQDQGFHLIQILATYLLYIMIY